MISPNFKDFPRVGRIMGIDWGARRCGVAVTDAAQEFFFERAPIVVGRGDDVAARVMDVVRAENPVAIVVGLPTRGDGTESDTTIAVRAFVMNLEKVTDTPIFLIDETLSSYVAQESLGRVRRGDIKEKLDSAAARVILENAISMARRA